jgi:hypothetical protein
VNAVFICRSQNVVAEAEIRGRAQHLKTKGTLRHATNAVPGIATYNPIWARPDALVGSVGSGSRLEMTAAPEEQKGGPDCGRPSDMVSATDRITVYAQASAAFCIVLGTRYIGQSQTNTPSISPDRYHQTGGERRSMGLSTG